MLAQALEVLYRYRHQSRLSGAWNTLTPQNSVLVFHPAFEFGGLQKPLASTWLSSGKDVAMLCRKVIRRDVVDDFLMLLLLCLIMDSIDSFSYFFDVGMDWFQ